MIMQLGEACDGCEFDQEITRESKAEIELFTQQYSMLEKDEVVSALMVPAKSLFTRLAQTVACVGCRRRY